MDVLEGVGEPGAEELDGTYRQRPVRPRLRDRGAGAAGDDAVEGGAGDVAGGDPGDRGLGVGVQDRGGPGAADLVGGADLLAEAGAELGLFGELAADELEGDGAASVGAGEEDLAHAALSEPAEEAVRTYAVRVVGPELVHVRFLPCGPHDNSAAPPEPQPVRPNPSPSGV
ncbi:hypothetical protein YUYDRAFT_05407 [Streptomyces sp. ScaeMP-e48]|nr:hypothetical protein YUYDRAFT_05407 [Streptomyces sp. ScaeMP-e48]